MGHAPVVERDFPASRSIVRTRSSPLTSDTGVRRDGGSWCLSLASTGEGAALQTTAAARVRYMSVGARRGGYRMLEPH